MLTGVASNRGTDDPIVTLTFAGSQKFPEGMLYVLRRTGASGSAPATLPNPPIFPSTPDPYVDEGVGQNTTYSYCVESLWAKCYRASKSTFTNQPALSNTRAVLTPASKKPTEPSGLKNLVSDTLFNYWRPSPNLTIVNGNQIQVAFNDNATIETGFSLERSVDGGATWPVVYMLGIKTSTGAVTYTDTDVVAGVTYTYRVKAVNSASVHDSAYTWPNSISF